jgi:hypothetical protein
VILSEILEMLAEILETLAILVKLVTLEILGKVKIKNKTRPSRIIINKTTKTHARAAERVKDTHIGEIRQSIRRTAHLRTTPTGIKKTSRSRKAKQRDRCGKMTSQEWINTGNHSNRGRSWTDCPGSIGLRKKETCP